MAHSTAQSHPLSFINHGDFLLTFIVYHELFQYQVVPGCHGTLKPGLFSEGLEILSLGTEQQEGREWSWRVT